MQAHRLSQSPSKHVVAFLAALLCTALQLAAVVALADTPATSAGVQMVELERVVVTGKRVAATEAPQQQVAGVCEPPALQRC